MRISGWVACLLIILPAPALAGQPPAGTAPSALAGTRAEQVAQLIAKIIPLATSRNWDEAFAAFPGAQWQEPTEFTDGLSGDRIREVRGQLQVAGLNYRINLNGRLDRLGDVTLDAPEDVRQPLNWAQAGVALAAQGIQAELIVCADGPRGDGYRTLSLAGQSALLNFYTSDGHRGESYHFGFDNPYNPASDEAGLRQMMADRCGRRR